MESRVDTQVRSTLLVSLPLSLASLLLAVSCCALIVFCAPAWRDHASYLSHLGPSQATGPEVGRPFSPFR
eukprot:2091930-Prymnesium_polylepis.1